MQLAPQRMEFQGLIRILNPKDYYFAQVDIVDDYNADMGVIIHLIEQNRGQQ